MSIPKATFDLHFETPPHPSTSQPPTRSDAGDQVDDLSITFDKTIAGHYRHGKTGYKKVGALFLTWKKDDLQCKATEVDHLRDIFAKQFHFETDYFEIPEEKWQTTLHKRVADFVCEYDSPDCLAIIYYGGHGYLGTETGDLKLAAKFEPDGDGDPTVFFEDIRYCLRLPACDQFLIVDCCYAAKAFHPNEIGKRKFELLTSAGGGEKVPAPKMPGSFTKTLKDVIERLLESSPTGFCTSQLYRELYHKVQSKTKPFLFDQARHNYGKIWLRPQVPNPQDIVKTDEGGRYLNLTLRLHQEPSHVMMNELAQALSYLPHVEQVRFERLYAPKRQIEKFMQSMIQVQRLRPLIRKLHARLSLRKVLAKQKEDTPHSQSLVKLLLNQKDRAIYDWSSAVYPSAPKPKTKSPTWPPAAAEQGPETKFLSNRLFSMDYKLDFPGRHTLVSKLVPRRASSGSEVSKTQNNGQCSNGLINSTASPKERVETSRMSVLPIVWQKDVHRHEILDGVMCLMMLLGLVSLFVGSKD